MRKIGIFLGVTGGIGRALLPHVRKECDEWWLVGRSEERLRAVAEPGDRILCCEATELTALTKALEQERPQVGWLIHAAGVGLYATVENNVLARDEIEVNISSVVESVRAVLPFMSDGGRILLMSSGSAFLPQSGFTVYAASKAFVLSFARGLRGELRARRIRVSAACPGPVDTPFLARAQSGGVALPRYKRLFLSSPERVARAVYRGARRGRAVICPTWDMKAVRLLARFIR